MTRRGDRVHKDDLRLRRDKFAGESGKAPVVAFGPVGIKKVIPALQHSVVFQATPEVFHDHSAAFGGTGPKQADPGDGVVRLHGERPCCGPADQPDELPPPHAPRAPKDQSAFIVAGRPRHVEDLGVARGNLLGSADVRDGPNAVGVGVKGLLCLPDGQARQRSS
jgi:hypothetical protein